MGLRYILGPSFGKLTRATAAAAIAAGDASALPPATPPRRDVEITLKAKDEAAWTVTFRVPPYDLAACNRLAEIRVYLFPESIGANPPTDVAGFFATPYMGRPLPFTAQDVSALQSGGDVTIALPDVADGDFGGRAILGFDDAPPPAPADVTPAPASPAPDPAPPAPAAPAAATPADVTPADVTPAAPADPTPPPAG